MDELFRLIFSADFVASVLRMSTPILFVGLAAMVGDKADVLCVAYEGIMLFAAFGGVVGSALLHSLAGGLTGGLLAGLVITGIFAYFVLYMDAKPMLIGLALNILASAGTVFGLYLITGSKANSANLGSMAFSEIHIPVVENIPVIGGIVSGHNTLTYFVFLCVFLVQMLLYRTPLGLRIRTAGEAPLAAASVGINVSKKNLLRLSSADCWHPWEAYSCPWHICRILHGIWLLEEALLVSRLRVLEPEARCLRWCGPWFLERQMRLGAWRSRSGCRLSLLR